MFGCVGILVKLAVSNIAWDNQELDAHLSLLEQLGCHGVEIAPSCIWPEPVDISQNQRQAFRDKIQKYHLELVGLHALLYTRPDLEILGTPESNRKTREYITKNFELCRDLGGKVLVFGSPPARRLNGKSYDEAFPIAVQFFKELGRRAGEYNVCLCIEPLSYLETEFIQNSEEGARLVREVNQPHFQLLLDAKAMVEANEDIHSAIGRNRDILRHFHVNDSALSPPGSKGFDHRPLGNALSVIGYDGYVSIEMRRNFGPTKDVIRKSVEFVRNNYAIDGFIANRVQGDQ
jgi:sugar phosphate isomerase/epimerase